MLLQALCITPKPSVNHNLNNSPETLNSGQNQIVLSQVTLQFDKSYSQKPLIWVKIDNFLAVWPWNLTDDLEKQ